jgi:hypothetical protein
MTNQYGLPIEVNGGGYLYTDGKTWSAADDGGWLPGLYADEAAARKALVVINGHYGELVELARWEVRGKGDDYRPITVAELDAI